MVSSGPMSLTYQVSGKSAEALLTRLSLVLSPPGVAAYLGATVDPWITRRAKSRFANEGDDVVGNWLPLASATQQIRASQGYGADHPINHRTGALEQYITGSPPRITMSALGATLTSPGHAVTGKLRKKLDTAQSGTGQPNTPPRPVMGFNERDFGFVMTSLMMYIRTGRK